MPSILPAVPEPGLNSRLWATQKMHTSGVSGRALNRMYRCTPVPHYYTRYLVYTKALNIGVTIEAESLPAAGGLFYGRTMLLPVFVYG